MLRLMCSIGVWKQTLREHHVLQSLAIRDIPSLPSVQRRVHGYACSPRMGQIWKDSEDASSDGATGSSTIHLHHLAALEIRSPNTLCFRRSPLHSFSERICGVPDPFLLQWHGRRRQSDRSLGL